MDKYLAALVRWTSELGDENTFSITITVRGAVVTGYVVSENAYFEGLATKLGVPVDILEGALGRSNAPSEAQGFIHLRDAQIKVSNLGGPMNVGWWRAPLEAVDGFAPGRLDWSK